MRALLRPGLPLALLLGLATALYPSTVTHAQQPSDSAAVAEPHASLVDSLRDALDRFKAARPPTAADSAVLHRWTDSVQTRGNALRSSRPAQARTLLRRARQGSRGLSAQSREAAIVGDIGTTHHYQSQYQKALTHYKKALRVSRDAGNRTEAATSLHNIGILYLRMGRYQKAVAHSREALSLYRTLDYQRGIAAAAGNLGGAYKNQGLYEQALRYYRESLSIEREIGNRSGVATTLNNLGIIRRSQGHYEEALQHYRESLSIKREIEDQDGVATTLNNLGVVYAKQGQYEEAQDHYRESLAIKRKIGNRAGVASALANLGDVYQAQNQSQEALRHYYQALELNQEIGRRPKVALNLRNIGTVRLEQGRVAAARDTLNQAVRLAETLRLRATSPDARRSLLATQIEAYHALTTGHVRAGRPDSALHAVEQARARLLADRLAGTASGDTTFAVPPIAELRRTLEANEKALLYANAGSKWPLTALAITRDSVYARELPDSTIRADVKQAYPARLQRLRRQEGPLAAAAGDAPAGDDGLPSLAETIRLYRYYLVRDEADSSIQQDLARRLHALLVGSVEASLPAHDELLVVPTGALGYLPFETLRDSTGRHLVQNKHVRYTQSLTVLRQLQARDRPPPERSLLAFGGATYAPNSEARSEALIATAQANTPSSVGAQQAVTLFRNAERQLERGQSPRQAYAQLGYQTWTNLPGTKTEAERLGGIAGTEATVLTGESASEQTIREMSDDGRLAQYRRLHFATHGVAVREAPDLSALVLSQTNASDSLAAEDGYLTMEEIAGLNLQAEVAVLSACQTGLGRIVAGEGVVSLSHAFLRAGANATLVSQWKVLDKSTRQFMTAVYERARNEDTSFAEAVTQTKRAFIAGEYGETNTNPLRWAPFVYYGRE